MRIVLVQPAGSNWVRGRRDMAAVANRMAPLGLLSIAAWLEREGHEVSVLDCLGPGAVPDGEANARTILAFRPDMVGFSTTTSSFLDGHALAIRLKEADPRIRTVFGGVHVSAIGGALLERFGAIDYLCPGEGEVTLAALAGGEDPAGIDGLIRRDGERVVAGEDRKALEDLDRLPFPAYHLLRGFPRGYNLPLFSYIRTPGATMVTSRGCPYRCSYCDRSVFRQSYRVNSPEYIHEHLRYLRRDFGVRHVNIYDDLFTAHRPRIAELCRLLRSRPLGIQFNCAVRAGHTDRELLGMLREAGCLMVSVGVESGEPELLARHKAGVTLEEIRETVALIRESGLRVKGLFMMGLPGETEESIRKTSDFCLSLRLDDMNMAKFTPFPGAPVWGGIRAEGTFEEDWPLMNCLNFVFVPRGIASRDRLDELYNRHVKRFYTDPGWRNRLIRRTWQHRWSLWYLFKHLPQFWTAKNSFEPRGDQAP
ncbi:MAG: B12-binding domain-containing radical SAM protein [Syntrophales bacterium]